MYEQLGTSGAWLNPARPPTKTVAVPGGSRMTPVSSTLVAGPLAVGGLVGVLRVHGPTAPTHEDLQPFLRG